MEVASEEGSEVVGSVERDCNFVRSWVSEVERRSVERSDGVGI